MNSLKLIAFLFFFMIYSNKILLDNNRILNDDGAVMVTEDKSI